MRNSLVVVTGFGDKGIHELIDSLQKKQSFHDVRKIDGCPWYSCFRDPWRLIDSIRRKLTEIQDPFLLIGHSYGALLSLASASQVKRDDMDIVLIDGPLNPDVDVSPPREAPLFHIFARQYANQAAIARESVERVMRDENLSRRILTFGSKKDAIVPPASKSIPGVKHIELPDEIRGHSLHFKKIKAITEMLAQELKAGKK